MKKIIFTFLFAISANTGLLLSKIENSLEKTSQTADYTLQALSREQVPNNRKTELSYEDLIGQGAEKR
ncbi:MAG: hypothetical protein A3F67_04175 [Verrucomicrobia bacterium RIFCSPHIGHO2_12_FULL_41_10]|nr:MAG: hypothetical protein A3F67_04175 [Verrucomicrobia bacterium RIFCSPHIGHO2_12_FULL_41_10]HLB33329.1 hypothetical protein [Chthoniobacterales bacterium]